MPSLAGQVIARFEKRSPLTVMTRALFEHVLTAESLDELFRNNVEHQYEQNLLFSTVLDVMTDVVLCARPSVRQSYIERREQFSVSLTSLYNKLNATETSVSEALIRWSSEKLSAVQSHLPNQRPALVPGFELKILDGNCVASTEHRIKELRTTNAGALPGKSLAIYDAATDLFEACLLCEDGHAQERSLFDRWMEYVKPGQLWLDDRNFCTLGALFGIHERGAKFITREHATNAPWEQVDESKEIGRVDTGTVYEQRVKLTADDGRTLAIRRITLKLDVPTRDGEIEIHLLTNLTKKEMGAQQVADMYRNRWSIEKAFLHLTMDLNSEINTLGYPRAALLGFAVGVVAYNMVSTLKAAIRAEHGQQKVEQLSGYSMSVDIRANYEGMDIAVEEEVWEPIRRWTAKQLAEYLQALATKVDMVRFKKSVRGPKKPAPKRTSHKNTPHVSTAKLLATRKRKEAP